MASMPSSNNVLTAIESYLANRVSLGDQQAKSLHRMLLPLLTSPEKDATQDSAEAFEEILDSMAEAGAFDAEAEKAIDKHFAASSEPFGIERARENVVQRLMSAYSGLPIADRTQVVEQHRQALLSVDAAAEALISGLDHAGSLESPNIQRFAQELRYAVAVATGDSPRAKVAYAQLLELDIVEPDDDVQDVVENVLQRAQKYGFQPDENMVRDAVKESANLLNLELTEVHIVQACGRVMEPNQTISESHSVAEESYEGYYEVEVQMRSKTTFGTDNQTVRVWPGQSAREVAEKVAEGYGAEVVEIRYQDGTLCESEKVPAVSASRVEALPRLQQQAGAAYTLYQMASKALHQTAGDPMHVDWDQVHQDVFAKAVGQDKQPVASVLEAIRLHSPGAVAPEQLAAVEALGESRKMEKQLEDEPQAVVEQHQRSRDDSGPSGP